MNSLIKGAAGTIAVKITSLVIGFLFYLLLARILTASEFGQYSLVTSIGLIVAIIIRYGMDKLVIRYTAEFHENNLNALIKGIIIWSLCLTITLGMIATTIIVVIVELKQPHTRVSYYAIPLFIGVAITALCQGFFRANNQHLLALAPDQIGRQGISLFIVAIYYIFGANIDSIGVLTIHAAAALSMAFVTAFLFFKNIYSNISSSKLEFQTTRWLKSGLPVVWSNIMVMGELQAVILLSGWLLSLEQVGTISLVLRLSAIASLTLVAINLYTAPNLARLHIRKNRKNLQKALHQSARLASSTIIPIAAISIYYGREILSLFGTGYVEGYTALIIFIASRGISALFGSVGTLLTQTGYEKEVAIIFTSSFALMVVSSIALTPLLGLAGVSIGVLLSTILRSAANWYVASKKLHVSSFIF